MHPLDGDSEVRTYIFPNRLGSRHILGYFPILALAV